MSTKGTKTLAIFAVLAMVLVGLVIISGAGDTDADPETSLWVNGIDAINDTANLPEGCSYDSEHNILTIGSGDNLTVLKEAGGEKAVILDNRDTGLGIHIDRGRTISSDAENACGIYVKGDLAIDGERNYSLLVGMTGDGSYGLKADGNIDIYGGTMNFSGSLFGIWTMQNMCLSGGTVQSSDVDVNQQLVVYDSARLYAGFVNGVYGITVDGGILSADNPLGNDIEVPFGDFGLYCGSVELNGSGGLDANSVTISGGVMTMDGSSPCIGAAGSQDKDGILTITGGHIEFKNLTSLPQDTVLAYASSNGEGVTERLKIAPAAILDNMKVGESDPNTLTLIDPRENATMVFESLWVNGIDAINDSVNLPANCSYDPVGNTLTLNGAALDIGKFNGERPGGSEIGAVIYDNRGEGLNLVISGDNSIISTVVGVSGIYVSSDLTVSGTGSLNIQAPVQGIMMNGALTFSEATVTVSAYQFDVFILSGSLTMNSGTLALSGSGILDSNGDVTVTGGQIDFNVPSGTYRLGIMAGDFTVSGGLINFYLTEEDDLLIESSSGFQFTNGVTSTGLVYKTYGDEVVEWDNVDARDAYADASGEIRIGSLAPSPTLETAPVAASVSYNNTPQALIATAGTATNGTVMYALDDSSILNLEQIKALSFVAADNAALKKTDIGQYYVYYMVKGDGGYSDLYSTSYFLIAEIGKGSISPAITNITAVVEYGSAINPSVSGNTGSGAVSYTYEGILGTTYGPANVPPTEVGSYRVTATVGETAYYMGGSAVFEFEIAIPQGTLWVNGIDAVNDPTHLPANCSFDAENNVLTLSGVTLNAYHPDDAFGCDGAVILSEREHLTLYVEGDNTISYTDGDVCGVYTAGNLHILGTGTLTIASSHYAILTGGSMQTDGDLTLNAAGKASGFDILVNYSGISDEDLSIYDSTLNLNGSGCLDVNGSIEIVNGTIQSSVAGAQITATGSQSTEGTFSMSAGTLEFTGVTAGFSIVEAAVLEIGTEEGTFELDNLEFGDGEILPKAIKAKAAGKAVMTVFMPFWVNGVDVIGHPEDMPDNCTYDRDTNTLTLKGAALSTTNDKAIIESLSNSCLNLVVEGKNTISNDKTNGYGIISNGGISITGTGSLDVNLTGSESIGINSERNLTIEGATVIVSGTGDFDVFVSSGDFIMESGQLELSGVGRMDVNGNVLVIDGEIDFDVPVSNRLNVVKADEFSGIFIIIGGKINFNNAAIDDLLLTAEAEYELNDAELDGIEFKDNQQTGFHQAFATKAGTVSVGSGELVASVSDWTYGDETVPTPKISGTNPTQNDPVFYYYAQGKEKTTAKQWSTITSGKSLVPGAYNLYATIAGDEGHDDYETPVSTFTVDKFGINLTSMINVSYTGSKTFVRTYYATTGDEVEYSVTASSSIPGEYRYGDGSEGTYTVSLVSDMYELKSCTATLWISSYAYFYPEVSGEVAKAPTEDISEMFEKAKKDGARVAYVVIADAYDSLLIDPAVFRMIGSTYDPNDDDEINGSAFGVSVKNGMTLFYAKAMATTVLPQSDMALSVYTSDTKPAGFEDYDIAKVVVSSLVAGNDAVTVQADNCVQVGVYYDVGTHSEDDLRVYAFGSDGALVELSQISYNYKSADPEHSQLIFTAGTIGQFGVAFKELRLTHKVTYDANGGSAEAPVQADVMQGTTFTVADYTGTKTGYSFVCWNDGADDYKAGNTYTMGTKDVTLTAVWKLTQSDLDLTLSMADYDYGSEPSKPVLTGNAGDGEVTYMYRPAAVQDDGAYTPAAPTEVGEYTVRATVAATADYKAGTVTANFKVKAIQFTVAVTQPSGAGTSSIEYDGKDAGSFRLANDSPVKIDVNQNVVTFYTGATSTQGVLKVLTATADADHKFAQWTWKDASGKTVSQPTALLGDMSVTAGFVDTAKYVVKIGSMTGGSVTASPASGAKDTKAVLTISPSPGYRLQTLTVGDSNVTSDVRDGKYTLTLGESDVTVNATFLAITYFISFDNASLAGADNSANTVTNYNVLSENIVLKDPVRSGYVFGGWFADAAYVNKITMIETSSMKDYTLYALWAKEVSAVTGEDGIQVSSADSNTVIIGTDLGQVEKETTVSLNTGTGQGQSDSSIVFPAGTVFGEKPMVSIINTTDTAKDDQGQEIAGEGELIIEIKLTGISLASDTSITVTVPYVLPEGVDPSDIKVYFLDDTTGIKKLMTGVHWEDGQVSFDTTHNSMYQISTANQITAINLSSTSVSLSVNSTKTLTYTTVPANPVSSEVVWSSSNTSVATVDQNGKITAKKAGTAIITCASADVEDVKATCTVKVSSGGSSGGGTEPIVKYVTVTIKAGDGGKVSRTSISVPSGSTVKAADNVLTIGSSKVTATPDEGYMFDSWSMTSGAIRSSTTITASFSPTVVPDRPTVVDVANGSVVIPKATADALKITDPSKLDLKILESKPSQSNIPASAKAYEITLSYDGRALTTFSPAIEITVDYIPGLGADVSKLKVYYVSADGTTVQDMNAVYDADKGGMVFSTTHLSTYVVSSEKIEPVHQPAVLSSISVKTAPSKTSYKEGEKFDPTGLAITLTYSDRTTKDVDYKGNEAMFSFSPSGELKASDKSVTITYEGKTASQAITVSEKSSGDNTMLYIAIAVIIILIIVVAVFLMRRKV